MYIYINIYTYIYIYIYTYRYIPLYQIGYNENGENFEALYLADSE